MICESESESKRESAFNETLFQRNVRLSANNIFSTIRSAANDIHYLANVSIVRSFFSIPEILNAHG